MFSDSRRTRRSSSSSLVRLVSPRKATHPRMTSKRRQHVSKFPFPILTPTRNPVKSHRRSVISRHTRRSALSVQMLATTAPVRKGLGRKRRRRQLRSSKHSDLHILSRLLYSPRFFYMHATPKRWSSCNNMHMPFTKKLSLGRLRMTCVWTHDRVGVLVVLCVRLAAITVYLRLNCELAWSNIRLVRGFCI